jgi:hypothetical protein
MSAALTRKNANLEQQARAARDLGLIEAYRAVATMPSMSWCARTISTCGGFWPS